jgi:hypothetical protein
VPALTMTFDNYTRGIVNTRLMSYPRDLMDQWVKSLIQGKSKLSSNDEEIKYLIYSAHDDTISNLLLFLNPYDF